MTIEGRAEEVTFTSDEGGWRMLVETNVGTFKFNIQGCAWDLAEHADETIGAWRREGEDARASRPAPVDLDAYPVGSMKRIALEQEMT